MARAHEITITPMQHHVEVKVGSETVAKTDRPLVLRETGLPARYYLPRQDVQTELLHPTSHRTTCPFKGEASYWSVEVDGHVHENVVWSYEDPIAGREAIAGLLCFYNERVELLTDEHPAGEAVQ